MATIRAIAATCEAIRHLLRSRAAVDNLGFGFDLDFEVYGPGDFDGNGGVKNGASIFLYRVLPSLSHRTPAGRVQPNGTRRRTRLPLDLHILLTAWAERPETENTLVAWMMRTLEDSPILPASVLNMHTFTGTFADDEAVELAIGEMSGEEILHLWEILGERIYHISVPYVARCVYIDSDLDLPSGEPVQVRALRMGTYDGTP